MNEWNISGYLINQRFKTEGIYSLEYWNFSFQKNIYIYRFFLSVKKSDLPSKVWWMRQNDIAFENQFIKLVNQTENKQMQLLLMN